MRLRASFLNCFHPIDRGVRLHSADASETVHPAASNAAEPVGPLRPQPVTKSKAGDLVLTTNKQGDDKWTSPVRILEVGDREYAYHHKPFAQGAYCRVYRALDVQTGEPMVVAKLQPQGQKFWDRLEHENAALQAVNSPLQPRRVLLEDNRWDNDDRVYLLLPWMGGDLLNPMTVVWRKPAAERKQLGYWLACQTAREVLPTLVALHAKGWTHRDLKPDNVLYDPRFNMHVGDFGFATPEGHPRCAEHCMTRSHAAPEAYWANRTGEAMPKDLRAADVYSLGVTLLHVAVGGAFPFRAPRTAGKQRRWLDQRMSAYTANYENIRAGQEPQGVQSADADDGANAGPLFAAFKGLDKPLREIILDAMHPDPYQRPTMADLQKRVKRSRFTPTPEAKAALQAVWQAMPQDDLERMKPVLSWLSNEWLQRLGIEEAEKVVGKMEERMAALGLRSPP